MYKPKQHSADENKINYFNKKTTKELEKELTFIHRQDRIGGFDAIEISKNKLYIYEIFMSRFDSKHR